MKATDSSPSRPEFDVIRSTDTTDQSVHDKFCGQGKSAERAKAMINLKAHAFAFSVIVGLASWSGVAIARALVTQATGPSADKFAPGTVLPEPLDITLVKGDRLTVLDGIGTRILTGPLKTRNVEVRRPPADRLAALRKLFNDGGRNRAAGIRSMTDDLAPSGSAAQSLEPTSGNLWAIGPGAKGDWCITDPDSVELWREQVGQKGRLLVTTPSGATYEAVWPKGEHLTFWPSESRIAEGNSYQLKYASDEGRFVTLHLIKSEEGDLLALARELLRFDCHAQLDMLSGNGEW